MKITSLLFLLLSRSKTVFADRRLSRLISFYPVGRLLFRMSILSKRLFLFAGSLSQRAIEYPWVLKHLPRRPNALVLDVGCSESLLSHELIAKGYQVIGIDIQKYPWKTHRMSFYQTNIIDTRLPPNLVDMILVVSTIEHIGLNAYGQLILDQNGDLKAMAELRRILKSGGALLLTTPYIGKGPIRITSAERRYDRGRLNKLTEGFEIVVEEYFYPVRVNERLLWISLPKDKIDYLDFREPGLACFCAQQALVVVVLLFNFRCLRALSECVLN